MLKSLFASALHHAFRHDVTQRRSTH
jgi:hypothetical protein